MCQQCAPNRHLLAKDSPSERRARERFMQAFTDVLADWHDDILEALEQRDIQPTTQATAREAIKRLLEEHETALTTTFETLWEEGASAGRATAARRYGLEISDELRDEIVRELQATARESAFEVGERMTDDIAGALRDAYTDGLAIPEIEDVLKEEVFPEMRGYEAERAARTEGTSAANRGVHSSFEDSDAVGKEWLAESDDRTRDAHLDADGQTVPLGQAFQVDGEAAQHPGDPSLSAENRINCRCAMAPVWEL